MIQPQPLHQTLQPDVAVVHSNEFENKTLVSPKKETLTAESNPDNKILSSDPTLKQKNTPPKTVSENKILSLETAGRNNSSTELSSRSNMPLSESPDGSVSFSKEPFTSSKNSSSETATRNTNLSSEASTTNINTSIEATSTNKSLLSESAVKHKSSSTPAVQRSLTIESSLLNSSTHSNDCRHSSTSETKTTAKDRLQEPLKETSLTSPHILDFSSPPPIVSNMVIIQFMCG